MDDQRKQKKTGAIMKNCRGTAVDACIALYETRRPRCSVTVGQGSHEEVGTAGGVSTETDGLPASLYLCPVV